MFSFLGHPGYASRDDSSLFCSLILSISGVCVRSHSCSNLVQTRLHREGHELDRLRPERRTVDLKVPPASSTFKEFVPVLLHIKPFVNQLSFRHQADVKAFEDSHGKAP